MIGNQVSCDDCNKDFEINKMYESTVTLIDDVNRSLDITFFTCPHCGRVYIAFIQDRLSREITSEMYEQAKTLKLAMISFPKYKQVSNDYDKNVLTRLERSKKLKAEYETNAHMYTDLVKGITDVVEKTA